MSNNRRQPRPEATHQNHIIEVKSKFEAEFRRFGLDRRKTTSFDDFYNTLESLHSLDGQFIIAYPDKEGDLLPINNDDNFHKALTTALPLLRLVVQRKGENVAEISNYASTLRKKKATQINPFTLISPNPKAKTHPTISLMEDFRQVSSIVDVDTVPETHRRVKLCKQNEDKPLGFYIRDGLSVRVTESGLSKVPGIFISRLVPGGLAESTGLLSVNDEVLEVNGIEVAGKTLDQVTDMMIANSSNLIITVKPVNQMYTLSREQPGRVSKMSTLSGASGVSAASSDSDEVKDVLPSQLPSPGGRQDDASDRCLEDNNNGEDDDDEDIVRDHAPDGHAPDGHAPDSLRVKNPKQRSTPGSPGSSDRRSVGSGKSFGSHRDSARNNRSHGGSAKSNASSSSARDKQNDAASSPGLADLQRKHGSSSSGRSTPTSNGVLLPSSRGGSTNNNKQKSDSLQSSSSLKSNKSDRSDGRRSEKTPILTL